MEREWVRGQQRRANWGAAARRRACTHRRTHRHTHACTPSAAAMQGPCAERWAGCARARPTDCGTAQPSPAQGREQGRAARAARSGAGGRLPLRALLVRTTPPASVALLAILEALFAPPSIPEGEKCLGRDFSFHLFKKMDLFARLKAGWGTRNRIRARSSSRGGAAFVLGAAFV